MVSGCVWRVVVYGERVYCVCMVSGCVECKWRVYVVIECEMSVLLFGELLCVVSVQ